MYDIIKLSENLHSMTQCPVYPAQNNPPCCVTTFFWSRCTRHAVKVFVAYNVIGRGYYYLFITGIEKLSVFAGSF